MLAHEFGHFAQPRDGGGPLGLRGASRSPPRWWHGATSSTTSQRRCRASTSASPGWAGGCASIVWSIRSLVDAPCSSSCCWMQQRAVEMELERRPGGGVADRQRRAHPTRCTSSTPPTTPGTCRRLRDGTRRPKGPARPTCSEIQTQVIGHMGTCLGDPRYGRIAGARGRRSGAPPRIPEAELAQPPRRCGSRRSTTSARPTRSATVAAPIDGRPAWALFDRPQALRKTVTAKLLGHAARRRSAARRRGRRAGPPVPSERYTAGLPRRLLPARSMVRTRATRRRCTATCRRPRRRPSRRFISSRWPADMERLRTLEKERVQARRPAARHGASAGGVIRHRGRVIKRRPGGDASCRWTRDLAEVNGRRTAHTTGCAAACTSPPPLCGRRRRSATSPGCSPLHFADPPRDNLRDLQGVLIQQRRRGDCHEGGQEGRGPRGARR